MIIVYSKDACTKCKVTKRELLKNSISFKDINVSHDPNAMSWLLEESKKLDQLTMPFIYDEEGNFLWSDFRPDLIKALKD